MKPAKKSTPIRITTEQLQAYRSRVYKYLLATILIFVAGHTSAQTRIWKPVASAAGVQVYCDSINIHEGQGYSLTYDLKVNIADTIVAGVTQYVTRYASVKLYPDSNKVWQVDNIYDTTPAAGNVWSESFSTDFYNIPVQTIIAAVFLLRPVNAITHP